MVFFGPKSPPQAKKNWGFWGPFATIPPLVIDNFVTRGGIVARISTDECNTGWNPVSRLPWNNKIKTDSKHVPNQS